MARSSSRGSGGGGSNRPVRTHELTMPPGYKPPTPADLLEEQRRDLLVQAEAEGWGRLVGCVVLGDELVYSFASGQRIVMSMPDGSDLTGPDGD